MAQRDRQYERSLARILAAYELGLCTVLLLLA